MVRRQHRIIVSAENNPYMAWQCKLFHFSCISRLNQTPVVIVHEADREWHSDFIDIVRAGGLVRSAPSYSVTGRGFVYPPRNTAGTLLHASQLTDGDEEFFVLCDPDMIFVREPRFPETLSADYYSYLNYDRRVVRNAARRIGITPETIGRRKEELRCGVPHVIPVKDARRIAEAWLEAIDAFTPRLWEISMYAFGFAVTKLRLDLTLTHMVTINDQPYARLKSDVIHYSHGDNIWRKQDYWAEGEAQKVWEPTAKGYRGTTSGEILSQIRGAKAFYRRFYV